MVNESYSVYPQALDGYATLPLRKNLVHEIRAEDHNRLRDAIVKIEQELGVQPSGTFATVKDRLDSIITAQSAIEAHIASTSGAHSASAISVTDTDDFFYGTSVEAALAELGLVLPHKPDVVGDNVDWVPNSGIPSFVDGYGTKFVYNMSDFSGESADNEVVRTQPRKVNGIKGIHIIEVSEGTNNGVGLLTYTPSTTTLRWQAPGDTSPGTAVDVSGLSTGEEIIVYSSNTTKALRVAKTSASLPVSTVEETFEVYGLEARQGTFSIPTQGFKTSNMITRTATSSSGNSRYQFMISGMVYPADTGTLVLQRKRHVDDNFFPIATLNLGTNFTESLRKTRQPVYIPSLTSYDTITLFDRMPTKRSYASENKTASGNNPYDNFTIDYYHTQIAKYLIPVSNSTLVGGQLTTASETTFDEVHDNTSAYRIVHYKSGVTDFSGDPTSTNIWSIADALQTSNDGDNTVRFSNLFVDPNKNRPGIEHINVTPPRPDTSEESVMYLSGIKYYKYESSTSYNRFGFRVQSDDNFASNTYVLNNTLQFTSDALQFPNGVGSDGYSIFGASVDLQELYDDPVDGYSQFSSINLPEYDSKAWYIVDRTYNTSRKLSVLPNAFSARAHITARFSDPFGFGDGYDAYGDSDSIIFDRSVAPCNLRTRILVNGYSSRSTDTAEYFTDEDYRVGEDEEFEFPTNSDKFTHSDGIHEIGGSGDDGYVLAEWVSTIPIGSSSLQQGARWTSNEFNICGLIYPQNNYMAANIMPFQFDESITYSGDGINITYYAPGDSGLAANYDGYGFDGDKIYQRLFSLGYPTSNAKLRVVSGGNNPVSFHDIAFYNEKRFAKIEVKIPGNYSSSSEWMDIGKLYSSGRYEDNVDGYSDGALCGAPTGSAGDFTVPFTFGTRNNANAGNMIAVRITYAPNDRSATNWVSIVDDAKTRIITMLELLAPTTSDL